jgi:hypothetical protein
VTVQPEWGNKLETMNQKEDQRLAAICGIYCGDCPAYLAPRQDDQAELARLAQKNQMAVQEVGCDGCLSDRLMPECRECRHGFRACAELHEVTWCHECREFPCSRLEDFKEIHVRNGVSHHHSVINELQTMKLIGCDAWLKQKRAQSACQACGRTLYWFERRCRFCGQPMERP